MIRVNFLAIFIFLLSFNAFAEQGTSPIQRMMCAKMRSYLLNDSAGRDYKVFEYVGSLNCRTLKGYKETVNFYCDYKVKYDWLDGIDRFFCEE